MKERTVRLAQTVVPFGVGAIYDVLGESFVACDIFHWRNRGEPLELERLARKLGVKSFRVAPSRAGLFGGAPGGVPYHRFPQWLFCSRCRRMTRWSLNREEKDRAPRCPDCHSGPRLVPMRFVMVCRRGHLADVPWDHWAHSKAEKPEQKQCAERKLRFRTRSEVGGGLRSLVVRCDGCDAERSLERIASPGSMKTVGVRCTGRQAWQRSEESVTCDETPEVVQRGASNLYYAKVPSALDIPPGSDWNAEVDLELAVTNHPMFIVLRSSTTGPVAEHAVSVIADTVGCTPERVLAIARSENTGGGSVVVPADDIDIEAGEWLAFITPRDDQDDRDRFVTRHVSIVGADERPGVAEQALAPFVNRVVLATRLREVRTLSGFTRYKPGGTDILEVRPDLGRGLDWLPAVEVFGEGFFLSFGEERLRAWEQQLKPVRTAANTTEQKRAAEFSWLPAATARFIFLHTLSHLLIRQLAFECGYSSASLGERIYCQTPSEGEGRAGILVYTAAGDAEGSLGGLVRQGEAPRLARTLTAALQAGGWCSSDPICREVRSGLAGINQAACHACALVSETSCAYGNSLLDRRLVVGDDGSISGFLSSVLETVLGAVGSGVT